MPNAIFYVRAEHQKLISGTSEGTMPDKHVPVFLGFLVQSTDDYLMPVRYPTEERHHI